MTVGDILQYDQHVVGLDIGDGLITAAHVRLQKDGRPKVTRAGWEKCDPAMSDRQIADVIRRLWRSRAFGTMSVVSCFRSPSLTLKNFRHPNLSKTELAATLRLEAEEALRVPPQKIAMDWQITDGPSVGAGQEKGDGILVAAPREEVERHLELLRMAGLYPVVLDVGVLAIGNLYTAIEELPPAAAPVCIANLGNRTADIAILYHDGFIYPRVVFSPAADWRTVADQLSGHIQDMMKYSEFKLRRDSVKRVMLCGSVPEDGSFRRGVSEGVGLPCEVWNPIAKLAPGLRVNRLLSGKHAEMGPALATCLGLALRSA